MNPNFFNNINPEQMRQFQNMMTPEMMKGMTNQLSSMSDDQLRNYLSSMGMGHISPQMFRSMSQGIGNMNTNDFNKMKNANPYKNNTSMPPKPTTIVTKLEAIKQQGNDLFKQNKLNEACDKYYEVINEIQMSSDQMKKDLKEELSELERASRLNIANCKLKLKEYDAVVSECLKVLEENKCFKAYYRLGIALLCKGKVIKAHEYLDTARIIGNTEDKRAVEPYLKECEEKMNEMKRQKELELEKEKEVKAKMEREEEEKRKEIEEKEKEKREAERVRIERELKEEEDKKKKEKEITKEVETSPEVSDILTNKSGENNESKKIDNSNEQKISEFSTMSDDEIMSFIKSMKTTDNETLKEMIKAQGMTCSNEDIELLKQSITPETFKLMQNQHKASSTTPLKAPEASSPSSPPIPNFKEMDYQSMVNYLKSHPEMMKAISPQLAQMLGGNEANPEEVINEMEKLFWLLNVPSAVKNFCLSKKVVLLVIAIFVLLAAWYLKR